MLAGPGLGGSLVQLLTAPVAVLVDAVSFLVSALLVGRVRAPERVGLRRRRRAAGCGPEIGEGLSYLWRDRRLRAIAGAAANVNFFGLMIFALLVVYLTRDHALHAADDRRGDRRRRRRLAGGALVAPRVAAPDRPRPHHRRWARRSSRSA